MANKFVTAFEDIGSWFKKVFRKGVSLEVQSLAALNTVAPEAELLLDLVDPTLGAAAAPIITEVQADMGTLQNLLKSGNTANVATFCAAIKANLAALLTDGHITNPASVTRATGIVDAVTGVVDSIAAQYPVTAAASAVAVA